jgi:hypothetical protein
MNRIFPIMGVLGLPFYITICFLSAKAETFLESAVAVSSADATVRGKIPHEQSQNSHPDADARQEMTAWRSSREDPSSNFLEVQSKLDSGVQSKGGFCAMDTLQGVSILPTGIYVAGRWGTRQYDNECVPSCGFAAWGSHLLCIEFIEAKTQPKATQNTLLCRTITIRIPDLVRSTRRTHKWS